MNILFYVDPLIECNEPYWKEGWATIWCKNIAQTLSKSKDSYNFFIAVNEPIAEKLENDNLFQKCVFSQKALLKPFDNSYLQASQAWYEESYSEGQLSYYVDLMKSIVGETQFELIITFTPVPFFKKIYPDALVLHHEYSLFSRRPFPQSWFFDPVGVYENSFMSKFQEEIKAFCLSKQQKLLLKDLQKNCATVFLRNNPFVDDVKKLRRSYRYVVLLPLQFSGYYAFDSLINLKSQYEYLVYCLEEIPDHIGVIITTHPEHPAISGSAMIFIKRKYKNAIFIEMADCVYASSQYFLPLVDAVITVSSSTGLQTLLFDKKLITLGGTCFDFISDSSNLKNLEECLKKENKDKNVFLYFYITRYAIFEKYLYDVNWLEKFLSKSISKRGNLDVDFYDNSDQDEALFKYMNEVIIHQSKYIPECRYDRASFIRKKNIATVYVDCGNGFGFEDKIVFPINLEGQETVKIKADLSLYKYIKQIRFDPVEDVCVSCKIINCISSNNNLNFRALNANKFSEIEGYIFYHVDPQFWIECDFIKDHIFSIEYVLKVIEPQSVINTIEQEKDVLKQEKDVLKQEKDVLKQERDVLKQEKELFSKSNLGKAVSRIKSIRAKLKIK